MTRTLYTTKQEELSPHSTYRVVSCERLAEPEVEAIELSYKEMNNLRTTTTTAKATAQTLTPCNHTPTRR